MATMCPKFKSEVNKALSSVTAQSHALNGGNGVCCFVWVAGPAVTPKGNPSKKLVKSCFSANCLDLTEGKLDAALKAIPGYHHHYVNLD